ncbi:unnamed protein product, partial [Effrenium voratum]
KRRKNPCHEENCKAALAAGTLGALACTYDTSFVALGKAVTSSKEPGPARAKPSAQGAATPLATGMAAAGLAGAAAAAAGSSR